MSELAKAMSGQGETTQDWLFKIATNRGWSPKYNAIGDLEFTKENLHFVAFKQSEDRLYLRLALPGFVEEADKAKLLAAANKANFEIKMAKAVVVDDKFCWSVIESYFESEASLSRFIDHMLRLLESCARTTLRELL